MAILTEVMIRKTIIKAGKAAISEAIKDLRLKLKRAEIIDKAIEDVIPRQYSGLARDRMKSLVKKYLKENHEI